MKLRFTFHVFWLLSISCKATLSSWKTIYIKIKKYYCYYYSLVKQNTNQFKQNSLHRDIELKFASTLKTPQVLWPKRGHFCPVQSQNPLCALGCPAARGGGDRSHGLLADLKPRHNGRRSRGEPWENWKETSGVWPLTLRGYYVTRTKPWIRRTGQPCISPNRRR